MVSTPYPYCILTLSANPAAASATDARGLAAAVADLTVVNVTRTIDVLNDLIRGLQGCVVAYQAMQGSVAGALDDLRAGRLRPAWSNLRAASWQPDYCDLDLLQIINKDPINDENNANHLLSGLASNIAGLIAAAPAPPPLPPR
jgi:pectinesterase inhibitor-like protein